MVGCGVLCFGLVVFVGDEMVGVIMLGMFFFMLQVGIGLVLIDSDVGIEDGQ